MNSPEKIDRDWCYRKIFDEVFRLRPADYQKDYPNWPGMVGIEIEMMPLATASLVEAPQQLRLLGEGGLQEKLRTLLKTNRLWKPEENQDGSLSRINLGAGDQLTFEPGGQLEYSSRPYPCLDEVCQRVSSIQQVLDSQLSLQGVTFLQMGSQPWQTAEQLGLQMPKPRYRAMDHYFQQLGPYGQRMMRETCTIQVNLDFGDCSSMLAKRYLLANLMAPLMTAIFAHSPVSAARKNGYLSQRAAIWQNLDRSRTGFPSLAPIVANPSRESCAEAYLDHVFSAKVVFVESLNYQVPQTPLSFSQWMTEGLNGTYPTARDFENHLSLHFPEVRARGFLELRSIDSQARAWQLVPALISCGLLYDKGALEQGLDYLLPHLDELENLWQRSAYGLQDSVLRRLSTDLVNLAQEGFKRLPPCYQGKDKGKVLDGFLNRFTLRGRTPADDVLDVLTDEGLGSDSLFSLQQTWLELLS